MGRVVVNENADNTADVAAALTRARKARSPSPWTEAVDFLDLGPERAKKLSIGVHGFAKKQRKSTASVQGEGSELDARKALMEIPALPLFG